MTSLSLISTTPPLPERRPSIIRTPAYDAFIARLRIEAAVRRSVRG